MAIVNRGNIVPFYNRIEDQWRYQKWGTNGWGIRASRTTLIPFQVYANSVPTTWSIDLMDLSDSSVYSFGTSVISEFCLDTTRKWFTYTGATITEQDCGWYYIKAVFDGTVYYSEIIHIVEDSALVLDDNISGIFRLSVNHSTDIGNVLYSEGYFQRVYLECFWDYPEIIRDPETTVNGAGEELLLSAVTTERQQFVVSEMIDNWNYVFKRFEDHDNISLRRPDMVEQIQLTEFKFEAEQAADGRFYNGKFSFVRDRFSKSGCEEDLDVSECATP